MWASGRHVIRTITLQYCKLLAVLLVPVPAHFFCGMGLALSLGHEKGSPSTESLAASVWESGPRKDGGTQKAIFLPTTGPVSLPPGIRGETQAEYRGSAARAPIRRRACLRVGGLHLGSYPNRKMSFTLGKLL